MDEKPSQNHITWKKHDRTNTGEKTFHCTKCDWSFSTSVLKLTRGLTGERNNLGAPNVTTVSLRQNTERIIIEALQVLSVLWTIPHKVSWKYRRELTNVGENPFKCTMCGKSFSESGYLKRNMMGPTQERNHFSAANVTGVFKHQSSKLTRGLTGERNNLGAPNVTRVSLN